MSGAEYASVFVREGDAAPPASSDALLLPEWRIEDWRTLLAVGRSLSMRLRMSATRVRG